MHLEIIDIKTIETPGKGCLSYFESFNDVAFDIKRIYYIYKVPENIQRGGHAHRHLTQILVCSYGSVDVILDDGKTKEIVSLDTPSKGLVVRDLVWRDMIWKEPNSVLMVAASDEYNEHDYIRNYEEFLLLAQKDKEEI